MAELSISYARVFTDEQDLAAQHDEFLGLGVPAERVYVDDGLADTNRAEEHAQAAEARTGPLEAQLDQVEEDSASQICHT